MDFVKKLELSDQKYQTNGNLEDEKYVGKLLFLMKDFVPYGKIVSQCILCQPDSKKTILVESVFHNFKFLTFATQYILRIKIC